MTSTTNSKIQVIVKDGQKGIKVTLPKMPTMLNSLERVTASIVYDEALPASLDLKSIPQGSTAQVCIKGCMRIEYVDGKRHGLVVRYRDTSHTVPHQATTYIAGKRIGIQKLYYPNGRISCITDVNLDVTMGKCWSRTGVLRQTFLTNKYGTFYLRWREDGSFKMFKFVEHKTKVSLMRLFAEDGNEHWNNYPCNETPKDISILDHHLIIWKMTQLGNKQGLVQNICDLFKSKSQS